MAQKYRPVLTLEQISRLIEITKQQMPMTAIDRLTIAVLGPFEMKIKYGALTPAYESETSIEKSHKLAVSIGEAKPIDLPALKKQAYEKQQANASLCSIQELQWATEYSIEQRINVDFDSMSVEEQLKYLSNL